MVEILHRAMELKVTSETLFQLGENEPPSSHKPLQRIAELKSEVDLLVDQSKKYVEHHHLFAEIPTSRRQYQYVLSSLDPFLVSNKHGPFLQFSGPFLPVVDSRGGVR